MPLVPIATFLAGALLTLLLPTLLLTALVVWYWKFSERVPDTSVADVPPAPADREAAPGMGNPAPATGNPGPKPGETGAPSAEG